MCHIILLLPIITLPIFYLFPLWTAVPTYLTILLCTWFVYYKLIAAMKTRVKTGKEGMMREEAVVIEDINPEGKIMVGSEIWTAESGGERFRRGQKVVISGFEGLTAIVRGPLEARIMARTPKTLG